MRVRGVVMSEGDQRAATSEVEAFSEEAFEILHRGTFAILWSFARRISGDEDEAHDVCQKAYLAIWRYWSQGRLREEPRRLLFRAARSAAIDVVRARERRARLARAAPVADQSATWLGVDLRDALRKLKPEDRTLLLLQAAAGFSYEELARVEGQTVGAVRSRLHRARRDLRAQLRGPG